MTTDPAATAALDQWRASATNVLDKILNDWRNARTQGIPIEDDLGGLALALRETDHTVVADLLAIAISRLGEHKP